MLPRRTFRRHQGRLIAGPGNRAARRRDDRPGCIGARRQQIEHVDADLARIAAVAPLHRRGLAVVPTIQRSGAMTLAKRHPDRIRAYAEIGHGRNPDAAERGLYLDDVTTVDAETGGGLRMDLRPRAPQDLNDGIREFLKPGLVGATPVAERRRRIGDEEQVAGRGDRCADNGCGRCGSGARGDGAGDAPLRQRRAECLRVAAARPALDEIAAEVRLRIPSGERRVLARDFKQHIRGGTRAGEHRIHRGLLQRDRSARGLGVTPALEGVQVGENEIAELRRLVRIHREAHLERHLRERVGKTHGLRKGVRGIHTAHEDGCHLAGPHALDRGEHVRLASHAVEAGHRFGRAHAAERGRSCRELETVLAPPTSEHQRGLRGGEFLREPLQRRGRDTACLRGGVRVSAALEETRDRQLAARLARDPLVGVQTRERAPGTHIDEARCAGQLRACVRKVELLGNRRAPPIEEVGAERDDEPRGNADPYARRWASIAA